MTETTASLKLQGSGDLNKYLEELNSQMKDLNKGTLEQEKSFKKLNKVGEETGTFTEKMVEDVKSLYEGLKKINQTGKDTFSFIKDTGSSLIKLDDGLNAATSGANKFALGFVGLKDEAQLLDKAVSPIANHFRDIAEAQGISAKAFVILDKTSKPIISGLNLLSNQLEKVETGFKNAEFVVADFSKTVIGVGAKSLTFFSQTFDRLGEDLRKSSILGGFFAKSFDSVSDSLGKSAKEIEKFGRSLDPRDLEKVDAAGERVASTFDKMGRSVDRLSIGVKLADMVGDLGRFTSGIEDASITLGTTAADGVTTFGQAAKVGLPLYAMMHTRLQMIGHAAKALGVVVGSQLIKSFGTLASTLGDKAFTGLAFVGLANATADAYLQAQGLNDTFQVMQNLGIDTTAASIAFQFGLVGEKLILSSSAAKEFGKTALTTFAQLEDAAAFVTTIGAGANFQLEGMEAGVESISAAMTELVSGPLRNAISSTEAANALYNALSAGVGVAADGTVRLGETNEFLAASLKLASGSGASAAQTLELLAKTSQVYSLSNAEAAETAAKLYGVVEQGIVTFPQLTSELGSVLAVAQGLGIQMEETLGATAALTKVMSAAEAQTGLSSLLASIAGQGAQAQKELQELGIRFDANSIEAEGLIVSLNKLFEATGGNSAQIKRIIPDLLAYRTAMTLMTSANEDAAQTFETIKNTGGEALDELFDRRQQSVVQQYTLLMNGFNEVLVDFGRRVMPAFQPGIDLLNNLLTLLQNLPGPIKDLIGIVVIGQTFISNIAGAIFTFSASLIQVIALLAGMRLATKLFTGELGKEFEALKLVNSEGFNLIGTIGRLTGLYNHFDEATAKVNAELARQKKLMSAFKGAGVDFSGSITSAEDLQRALSEIGDEIRNTKQRIDVLKNAGDSQSLVDLKATEKQLTKLQGLEKQIKKFVDKSNAAQKGLFEGLRETVDTALSSANLTIKQKRESLEKRLTEYFSVYGEVGARYKGVLEKTFDEIIGNSDLTTEAKIERINDEFRELGKDIPPHLRKNFNLVREEIVEAIQRMDGTFTSEFSKVKDRYDSFFSSLGNTETAGVIRENFDKISTVVERGLSKIGASSQNIKVQLEKAFSDILNDASIDVETKVRLINQTFEKLGANAPTALKGELEKVRVEVLKFVNGIEEAFGRAPDAKEWFERIDLDEALTDFENTITKHKDKINSEFAEIADPWVDSKVDEQVNRLKQTLESKAALIKSSVANVGSSVNLQFERIGGEETINRVKNNMVEFKDVFTVELDKTKQAVKSDVAQINNQLEKVGNVDGQAKRGSKGRLAGSVGDFVGNFVPGASMLTMVARDAQDVVSDFGDSFPKLGEKVNKSVGKLKLFNNSSKVTTITSKAGAASVGLFGKATGLLTGAASAAGSAVSFLSGSIATLYTVLAPIVGIAAIVVAGLYALHNIAKLLIPAYAEVTDGTVKLTRAMQKSTGAIDDSREKIVSFTKTLKELENTAADALGTYTDEAEKAALAALPDFKIAQLTGANAGQIKQLRKEVLDGITPDEKSFVQGWRAPVVSLLEFLNGAITDIGFTIMKLPFQFVSGLNNIVKFVTSKIPVVSGFFEKIGGGLNKILFRLNKDQKEFAKENRNVFNEIRENIQAGIARPLREAAFEQRQATEELVFSAREISNAYAAGGTAAEASTEIVKKAYAEQRSFTSQEMKAIIENERAVYENTRDEIQKNIEARQKELEQAKDPVVIEQLEMQINMLQEQGVELEKNRDLAEQYKNNIQGILQARDANAAVSGTEQLFTRTTQLYKDLTEEAKANFRSFGDTVIDEEGRVVSVTANLTSSAQRRAEAGFQAAKASFAQTIADVDDATKEVNTDQIATDLFNALDAVNEKVAQGNVSLIDGEAIKEDLKNTVIEVLDETSGEVQQFLARDVLNPNQIKALVEDEIQTLRDVSAEKVKTKEKEVAAISALEEQNLLKGSEAAKQVAEINEEVAEERLATEEEILKRLERELGKQSKEYIEQARLVETAKNEIAVEGFKDRKKILDEELKELQLQKDNEFEIIKQGFEREQALNEFRTKSINLEQQSLSAQKDLSEAITNLENSRLQNKLKLTGDIEEKARIETELAERRLSTLDAEQEYERVNLELQQELNKLTLEREKSTLRQTKAQLESNLVMAEAKLANAEALNLTEDETKALQLQVDALNQQIAVNNTQQGQLERQGQIQDQINEKQKTSLDLKQQAAKEQAATEVELAQIAEINAFYEKQKQQIQNNARETKLAGEERVNNLKAQSDILDQQTKILEKQFEIIKDTNALVERYYSLAKDQASTGLRQRRLEREAAKTQRDNLEQMQRIERSNLKIKQAQRDIALEIREIELESSLADQQATRAQAQADLAALQANPNASAEQIRAAELSVVAADQGIEGILRQLGLVDVERNFNESLDRMEQMQMQQNQNFESLAADARVADTTLTRGDDARISRQAQRAARENNEQLESLANTFERSMSGLQNSLNQTTTQLNPTGGSGSTMSSLSGRLNQNLSSANSAAPVSINGQVNLTVDIKGNTEGIDKSGLETKIADGFYRSFNELLDYSIRKQGS
jgi:TP901 family phage tail tape measure protein